MPHPFSKLSSLFAFNRNTGPEPRQLIPLLEHSDSPSVSVQDPRRMFTLSSTRPNNEVVLQRSFRGHGCIPSELADKVIREPKELLKHLNSILGTQYTFSSTPSLNELLKHCIERNFDLGMTYGMLRPYWFSRSDFSSLPSELLLQEREDSARRERAVIDELVVDCSIPPRRVWDLCSNRVLPYWMLPPSMTVDWDGSRAHENRVQKIMAVSHAWVFHEHREGVITPVNGKKWPVPIPRDVRLDDIRIELLNSTCAEYAWLDVLCLRQENGIEGESRLGEWKVDVPTIGTIYDHCHSVVFYFSGLGRQLEEHGLEDTFHWCSRAWTLQEWCCAVQRSKRDQDHLRIGGITKSTPELDIFRPSSFIMPDNGFAKSLLKKVPFHSHTSTWSIFAAVNLMCKRSAQREVDKIAGLAYLACGPVKPIFDEKLPIEDAWVSFVSCLKPRARAQLFFRFPMPGRGRSNWMPTWEQLLEWVKDLQREDLMPVVDLNNGYVPLPIRELLDTLQRRLIQLEKPEDASYTGKPQDGSGVYSCSVVCIPSCHISGFNSFETTSRDARNRSMRQGTVTFHISQAESAYAFRLVAYHDVPIPSDFSYCLISGVGYLETCQHWVVGFLDEEELFHKISILELGGDYDGKMEVRRDIMSALSLPTGKDEHTNQNTVETSSWIRIVKLA